MKHKIIYTALIALLFCGCDDYLDVEPKGKVIPSKVEDFDLLLNFDPYSMEINTMVPSADDFFTSSSSVGVIEDDNNELARYYTWAKDLFIPFRPVFQWNRPYNNIYACNLVINNIDDATEGGVEIKARIKAEARVLRAFEYYVLINSFAPQYDATTATVDPGVFIITIANANAENGTRESIQEVYDFIIKDIEESITNLPLVGISVNRPTKAGAYALLARVYLQMEDYDKAKENADEALELTNASGKTLSDIVNDWQGLPTYRAEQYFIKRHRQSQYWDGLLSDELVALFTTSDARKGTIWVGQLDFSTWEIDETRINNDESLNLMYGPSVPEMYLIKAECDARLGTNADVLLSLKTLREKRIENYYDPVVGLNAYGLNDVSYYTYDMLNINNGDKLAYVLEERRREMAITTLRWFDLKRLNKQPETEVTLIHQTEDLDEMLIDFTLPPNSSNYVFPIPPEILTYYPDLKEYTREDL